MATMMVKSQNCFELKLGSNQDRAVRNMRKYKRCEPLLRGASHSVRKLGLQHGDCSRVILHAWGKKVLAELGSLRESVPLHGKLTAEIRLKTWWICKLLIFKDLYKWASCSPELLTSERREGDPSSSKLKQPVPAQPGAGQTSCLSSPPEPEAEASSWFISTPLLLSTHRTMLKHFKQLIPNALLISQHSYKGN